MKLQLNKIFSIFTICLLSVGATLLMYRNLLGSGIPLTHDGSIHLVRMINYYLALRQGQIPPRLGPLLANSYGYPVFNFNYPLTNMTAVPFFILHFPYDQIYQFVILFYISLGAAGWWQLTRTHTRSRLISSIATILYLANPYLLQLVFVRGGVGEIAATSVFPWLLFLMFKTAHTKKAIYCIVLGIVGGMFLLAHNVMVLIAAVPLIAYGLYISKNNWSTVGLYARAAFIAIGLSAFFWFPALGEKKLTILDNSPINQDYQTHFVYSLQLITSNWGYRFSRPGPVDGLSFNLNAGEITGLTAAILWGLNQWRRKKTFWLIATTASGSLFLTLNESYSIWQHLPLINFIQFPWRFLWLSHSLIWIVILYWLHKSQASIKTILIIGIVTLLSTGPARQPIDRVIQSQETWINSKETTSTMNENSPKGFDIPQAYSLADTVFKDKLAVSTPSAEINIDYWTGSKRQYSVTAKQPVTIIERTAYFPGWETVANQQKITVTNRDPWKAGLLTYQLPAGEYSVTTTFTQNTPWRLAGNTLTILTLISTALFTIQQTWYKSKRNR